MADLSPVVGCTDPPQPHKPRLKTMTAQTGGDLPARGFVEVVVEPVVADGDGEGHLAHVEEVGRIPVLERADGAQLRDGAVEVRLVAVEAVRHGERGDSVERGATHGEQPLAFLDALGRRRRQHHVGDGAHVFGGELHEFIGPDARLDAREAVCVREQARMRLLRRALHGGGDFGTRRVRHVVRGGLAGKHAARQRGDRDDDKCFLHVNSFHRRKVYQKFRAFARLVTFPWPRRGRGARATHPSCPSRAFPPRNAARGWRSPGQATPRTAGRRAWTAP